MTNNNLRHLIKILKSNDKDTINELIDGLKFNGGFDNYDIEYDANYDQGYNDENKNKIIGKKEK